MDRNSLEKLLLEFWNTYYQTLSETRRSKDNSRMTVFFPTGMILSEIQNFWVIELIGARRQFNPLSQRNIFKTRAKTLDSYFHQFSDHGNGGVMTPREIEGGILVNSAEIERFKDRFPSVELKGYYCLVSPNAKYVLHFGENFEGTRINDCIILNAHQGCYRAKHILLADIIPRDYSSKDFQHYFYNKRFACFPPIGIGNKIPFGVYHVLDDNNSAQEKLLVVAQFQNLFLTNNVHETTIGRFFGDHPNFTKAVFNTDCFLQEQELIWQSGTKKANPIRPDMFIKRPDGNYDILDLKLPQLQQARQITVGESARRRFNSYTFEAIAQLVNYKEYFEHETNRLYAFEKYGIRVCEPKLIILTGNQENFHDEEVREAMRSHKNSIELISYDALCRGYMQ